MSINKAHLGNIRAPRSLFNVFNSIDVLQPHCDSVKWLPKGRDESGERAPGASHGELYAPTRGHGRGHLTVIDLAEVENKAACEDARDANECIAIVGINRLR